MNKKLKEAFDKTVSCFMDDPRVVAAYHSGSIGTHREDEFSDVDPVFLIKTEEFITFDRELPQLFEKILAKPILWWPERWIWVTGKMFITLVTMPFSLNLTMSYFNMI
jgi:hypothetical protein